MKTKVWVYFAFFLVSVNLSSAMTENEAKDGLKSLRLHFNTHNFFECVRSGDTTAVNLFLASGMSPDAIDSTDTFQRRLMNHATGKQEVVTQITAFTPLMVAAENGDVAMVKLLLRYNPNLEWREAWMDRTVLIMAIQKDQTDVIKLLLDKGAAVNVMSRSGISALMEAIMQRNLEMVHLLLKKGVNVNQVSNTKGQGTALSIAVALGNPEIVQALLDKGADVNKSGYRSPSTLIIAAECDRAVIIKMLLNHHAAINAVDYFGWTGLMRAAAKGNLEAIKVLLDNGASMNLKNKDGGRTALILAVQGNHPEAVKLLISKGVDINAQDDYNTTALGWAKKGERTEIIKLLNDMKAR